MSKKGKNETSFGGNNNKGNGFDALHKGNRKKFSLPFFFSLSFSKSHFDFNGNRVILRGHRQNSLWKVCYVHAPYLSCKTRCVNVCNVNNSNSRYMHYNIKDKRI